LRRNKFVLPNERFRDRRRLIFPIFLPCREARTEIARAFGEEMFGQFRCAPLKIALTNFNQGQKFVTFAFPRRLFPPANPSAGGSILAAQAIGQETQIMRPSEKITERAKIIG
jgi:hypothetical protein